MKLVHAFDHGDRLQPVIGAVCEFRPVVAMCDIDDGLAHQPGLSFGMDVRRKRESVNCVVVLNEIDLLNEEGWRLHDSALSAQKTAVRGINVDLSLKKSYALLPRLHFINVNRRSLDP